MGRLVIFSLLIITFFIGSRGSVTNDKVHYLTSPGSIASLNEYPSPPGRPPREGDSPCERQRVEQAGCVDPSRVSWGVDASSTDERRVVWDRNISMPTFPRDSLTEQRWKKNGGGADAMESRHPLVLSSRSTRRMLMMGPGDGTDVQQVRMYGAGEEILPQIGTSYWHGSEPFTLQVFLGMGRGVLMDPQKHASPRFIHIPTINVFVLH